MESADLGHPLISHLPIPRSRLGATEGEEIGKRPDSQINVLSDARFRHVYFRGLNPVGSKRKNDAIRPPQPPALTGPQSPKDADTRFLRRILAQAGLSPALYRAAPLVRRLPACLRALRVECSAAAERLLAANPALVSKALESLLIGTTELFRDPAIFTQLEHHVLPQIVQRATPPRIWSAACSDGAELYSVAMLVAKLGGLDGSHLLGSDCRPEAIERAKRGVYPPGERALPAATARHWQVLSDDRIAMSHEMRQAVKWEQADLLAPRALGTWDLILCRNLAIYLEPIAADRLWMRLADALAPDGFLVVGKAEKPRLSCLRRIAPSIYCKCTRLQPSS
ncbi:hypothetical protein OKA05_11080 [Luteolibacter arcticus]|uniref:CheR-type methyltransferase domain-containing protein n=1 Tax=Luteolibacter arcticus TaxID=1581411 RepID=A0ABT3GHV9_9BACT|nr:CheR family methyltransferase [Luteolibacter arcticus]MCW1923097.1 hypothetical protein [Luteolibacter arcticus]